jgi:hypothetical protein
MAKNNQKVTRGGLTYEPDLYMRVVDFTAERAKEFIGSHQAPVDLGPADPKRYKDGARVWGFPSREETDEERAHRISTVANGGEVL